MQQSRGPRAGRPATAPGAYALPHILQHAGLDALLWRRGNDNPVAVPVEPDVMERKEDQKSDQMKQDDETNNL